MTIVIKGANAEDTETIEEFFRRELAKGGHKSIIPLPPTPRHRAETNVALLALPAHGKHKATDYEKMANLSKVLKDVAKKLYTPIITEHKNPRDFRGPS